MKDEHFSNDKYKKIAYNGRETTEQERFRIPWLDVLRGLTVISMVCYHWMWDVVYIQNESYPWYDGLPGYIWQQSICWSFIILSGFSLRLGRHPLRRGATVFAAGALVTVVTVFILPRFFVSGLDIWFGVLTLLGSSMLIVGLADSVLKKIPPVPGLFIFAALFFVTRNVNIGFLGFEGLNFVSIPDVLYANYFTAFLGFPPRGFYSSDYFSLVPWIFLFLVGYYLYGLYENIAGERTYKKSVPILSTIGRGSLYIYIVHQPLITLLMFLIYQFK